MWAVEKAKSPKSFSVQVCGGKYTLMVFSMEPFVPYVQNWTKPHAKWTRFSWPFLERMNPRNLNHLMPNDLKRIANFCMSFPYKRNGTGEGKLHSLLYTFYLCTFSNSTPPPLAPNVMPFYWGSISPSPFYVCWIVWGRELSIGILK